VAQVPEGEITRLVGAYRKAAQSLARDFVAQVTLEDASISRLASQAMRTLDSLDSATAAWARRNLAAAYKAQRHETATMITGRDLSLKGSCRKRDKATIDAQALDALATDPGVGFVSSLKAATDGIRARLRLIRSQIRALTTQGRTVDEAIQASGALKATTLAQAKRRLVSELASRRRAPRASWRRRAASLGDRHVFANLANLPFVAAGAGRVMRLDRYAELVIGVKAKQATTMAQRNALMEHCQGLVTISRNQSQDNDACDLYVGRAFALTAEAAEEWDVPHVDQLPGGGAPFHPNCTHVEVPFFPETMKESVVDRATTWPPSWALGTTWAEVQKAYQAKGGSAYGSKQNPNMRGAQGRKQQRNTRAAKARQKRKIARDSRRKVG
jgi:minor capsid protein 2